MRRLGLLVSGSGTNMDSILRACREGVLRDRAEPAVVVSNRPGAGALERAEKFGVPAVVCSHRGLAGREEHEQLVLDVLNRHEADLVVLAGYMRILTPFFLERSPGPVLNIHPVPTHLYQGAKGYEWAWSERQRLAAVYATVHQVDAGVDTGRVVLFGRPIATAAAGSFAELRAAGLAEEHQLYPEALWQVLKGRDRSDEGFAESVRALETKAGEGAQLHCEASRRDGATEYELRVSSTGRPAAEPVRGALNRSERGAFTEIVLTLLGVSAGRPFELTYGGLPIRIRDTRRHHGT